MSLGNTRYMQYLAAFTGALTVGTAALYNSWTSPIFPKIEAGDSPLGNITIEQRSWIVSSLTLGHLPGSMISGWTVETFGRKGLLFFTGLPLLLPWLIIAFTSSVWLICIVRFIAGVAVANAINALILYNGEIAEKEIRGRIGATFNVLGLVGEMITFCIGPYVSYTLLTLLSSLLPLVFLIIFYFMPESPYYLMKGGYEEKARTNLKRLLKNNTSEAEVDAHMIVIKNSVDSEISKETSLWQFLSQKEYRKLLFLSFGIQTLHQFSGFIAINSYMQTIIQRSQSSLSPELSSMICGLVQFPAVFIAAAIVDKAGRKPLLIISALGCALALFMEGMYFYLQDVLKVDTSAISWVPTAGVLFYVVMRPIGIGTLTFILLGEIFPSNIKGHAVSTSSVFNNLLSFTVAKCFEPISEAWGMHVMFVFFSATCILGALFVYCFIPETKGKTFVEISEELNKSKQKVTYSTVSKL